MWSQIGIRSYHAALPEGLSGLYNYGQVVSLPGNGSRLDIFTNHVGSGESSGRGGLWWRSGWNTEKLTWRRIIDSGNIGSQSVSYASSSPAAANYGGTGTTSKIKIKINSTTSWMLSFVVTLYQGYRSSKIMISGYNYGSNYWYEPEAVLLGDSNGATSIPVYFGYDSAWNLWVGFDGGSYTGVSVSDVTNGYTQISSLKGLFTISNASSLSTLQKTVTATNSVNYAVSASSATTATTASSATTATTATQLSSSAGAALRPIYFSGGKPVICSYNLEAHINDGTANTLAYYGSATSINAYTSTIGSASSPIFLNAGVPTKCAYKYQAGVTWLNSSSGSIWVYQFGPIVILQGYVSKIGSLTADASVFSFSDNIGAPYDKIGFTLCQRNGYENDRNTVLYCAMSTRTFKVLNGYSAYGPSSSYPYYFTCAYITTSY